MLILHERKGLFIHVPKTGGSSIRAALEPLRDTRAMFNWHCWARTARDVLADYDAFWSFAFVRNPWALHVSWWKYMLAQPGHPYHGIVKELGTFPRYLREGLNPLRMPDNCFDQVDRITDVNGNPLVKFVGQLEYIERDWRVVCDALKLGNLQLPHRNRTEPVDWRGWYDEETAAIVRRVNLRDVEQFGYTF
jgi:hypothetical protein